MRRKKVEKLRIDLAAAKKEIEELKNDMKTMIAPLQAVTGKMMRP
jgi:hypothetical protein